MPQSIIHAALFHSHKFVETCTHESQGFDSHARAHLSSSQITRILKTASLATRSANRVSIILFNLVRSVEVQGYIYAWGFLPTSG